MTYLRRSVKYFCALCVLCAGLTALNLLSGHSALSLRQTLLVLLHTPRGPMLLGATAVLAALYPRIGFVSRRVEGNLGQHREQVLRALRSAGFSLRSEEQGVLRFRADTLLRRLALLGEDEIEVSQYGRWIVLGGPRRVVARVEYRLDSYLHTIDS